MTFSQEQFFSHLPPYLLDTGKGRIKDGLSQFIDPKEREKPKVYDNFYLQAHTNYFMQGDLFNSISVSEWDAGEEDFFTGYTTAMLVSNTCDVSSDNEQIINKDALFAPVFKLNEFFADLRAEGKNEAHIQSILSALKNQTLSHLMYLPPDSITHTEYVVRFDKIQCFPSSVINKMVKRIEDERFLSLSDWAFYLLIFKISYHFCRVPEEKDR